MSFSFGEVVTRHPFDGFEATGWGESGVKRYFADEDLPHVGVDPSPSQAQQLDVDPTVRLVAVLYGWQELSRPGSPHDEWTVRGQRLRQVGEVADWVNPFTGVVAGWMVRLTGRLG